MYVGGIRMKRTDINIRDPFVLVKDGKYYMYGSRGETVWGLADGFDVYVSKDLEEFDGPYEVFRRPEGFWADRHYWAPEVHEYNGEYYMFASFKAENMCRGTQILRAKTPMGPFELYSDGPVTPRDYESLDGTLYVNSKGVPYIIFCHEWTQVVDGEVCYMELSRDLKHAIGEPVVIFRGSSPEWTMEGEKQYVTDGPFVYRTIDGDLLIIWSGFAKSGYVQAIARSDNGDITGKWTQDKELLFPDNGGHGMIFENLNGELMLALHSPNKNPYERPVFIHVKDTGHTLIRV